jgi:hypothetical protein
MTSAILSHCGAFSFRGAGATPAYELPYRRPPEKARDGPNTGYSVPAGGGTKAGPPTLSGLRLS